jgi:hypothetical protein
MSWIAAGLIALVMSTAYMLDGLGEHDARVDTTEENIQRLCGENAGWKLLDDGSIQCFTHRGLKTRKVTL